MTAGARRPEGRVVVVGGSMAGLLAARALADHAESVVVLEREHLPDAVVPRGRVPQGRHLHLLLSAGLDLLRDWFPGIEDELESLGAVRVDGTGAWVHQGGAYRARGDWGHPAISQTRPLLEHVVRSRVLALPGVTVEDGVTVEQVTRSGRRVTGVVADGRERPADLVVDCSGRSSRIAHDLAAAHVLDPPVTHVAIDIGYASFTMRRSPDDFEGHFVVCIDSPGSFRVGGGPPRRGRPVAGDARRRPRRRPAHHGRGARGVRGEPPDPGGRPAHRPVRAALRRLDLPLPVQPAAPLREGPRPAPRARHAR